MALINLVQSQNVEILPIKALEVLKELRDLPVVLLELSKEFNIEKFLVVLLDSLIDCCSKDEYCQQALLSLIEKVPINDYVHRVVTKILSTCVKLSQKVDDSISLMSAGWAKKILIIVIQSIRLNFVEQLIISFRITNHIQRKTIHCIRFYARCWMVIWIHHLISQSLKFALPCIIQRLMLDELHCVV
ncbi:uncharacterized protein At3g06530-like [Vicia villosa]|uniref:uncharacterized protein At3g06530-like n=1 Tax=Vicia villosa TaxID=3911 RepID=UPI00273AC5D5|nr:uncharacterized protein At3g06530-like [Vicia villosa]